MSELFLEVAVAAARDAGAILRDRYGKPHEVRFKGTVDLVTEADAAAEALIADRLRSAFPTHRLLGEEGARGAGGETATPYRWVVDPLDGTTNFAHGLPHFAVSIGLEQHGVPIVGVVYDPLRDELFTGCQGAGAFVNGQPIQVSITDQLLQSILATGFSYDLRRRTGQAAAWQAFLVRVQSIRQTGSAALNLCYVAAGRLDGYWERGIAPWDVAAGTVIALEAGASVTNFDGGGFLADDREVVASNGPLHDEILAILRQHAPRPPVAAGEAAG
ncbi:MAG: inositol monophosphatase [Chloroflexota bacterium]|nr:inositol monophosphatase [Chloroflexota bacterium]